MLLFFIWQPIHSAGTPVGIIVFSCLAAARNRAASPPDRAGVPGRAAGRRDRGGPRAVRRVQRPRDGASPRRGVGRIAARAARAAGDAPGSRRDQRERVRRSQGEPAPRLGGHAERIRSGCSSARRRRRAGARSGDVTEPRAAKPESSPVGALDRRTRDAVRLASAARARRTHAVGAMGGGARVGHGRRRSTMLAGVLLASAPAAGSAQVVESAPRLALALGFDVGLGGWDGPEPAGHCPSRPASSARATASERDAAPSLR